MSPSELDDAEMAAVEKILGEPWMAELSDDALKVRRNLLIASFLSVAATLANIRIAQDSPIFGFHLLNLNDGLIRGGLSIVVGYLLVHFAWYVVDAISGWRMRVTGTRQAFVTTGAFSKCARRLHRRLQAEHVAQLVEGEQVISQWHQ